MSTIPSIVASTPSPHPHGGRRPRASARSRAGTLLALCLLAAGAPAAASPAVPLAAQRAEFARALHAAERGPESAAREARKRLTDHPLAPYLDYALLRRQLATASPERVRTFLGRHASLPLAGTLRERWLEVLAARGDWAGVRAFHDGRPAHPLEPGLRCALLRARLDAGTDAALLDDIQATWLSGTSLPDRCDPAFAALKAAGRITQELARRRIALAAEAGETGLMRWLSRLLEPAEAARVADYAAFIDRPTAAAADWPGEPLARQVAVLGLSRLARTDPDRAEDLFGRLATPLSLDATQLGQVRNALALWSAASYLPDSAQRFAAVPEAAWDARLHEWRVREALARGADSEALAALLAMPAAQREDVRWRYLEARLRERLGDAAPARVLFAAVAREPNYHGFLAADRLELPYALCPREPADDAALRARVAALPGLLRALELFELDRRAWAAREWNAALELLDDDARRTAVALAVDAGWYDRAVFALRGGEEQAYYSLRFPLRHGDHLRDAARRQALDPAWVAALIRAESVWMADARSSANARGLMQLLPTTGRALARSMGVPWAGNATLYHPLVNITLGTAYLRAMLERFDRQPAVATAAYNAGPTPATRWSTERPLADVDLWVETIPYHETREYVARVFAFSVIYDWRLHGSAVPLSERLAGRPASATERREFACPGPVARVASRP